MAPEVIMPMSRDPIMSRRKRQATIAALVVGLGLSGILAAALILLSRVHH